MQCWSVSIRIRFRLSKFRHKLTQMWLERYVQYLAGDRPKNYVTGCCCGSLQTYLWESNLPVTTMFRKFSHYIVIVRCSCTKILSGNLSTKLYTKYARVLIDHKFICRQVYLFLSSMHADWQSILLLPDDWQSMIMALRLAIHYYGLKTGNPWLWPMVPTDRFMSRIHLHSILLVATSDRSLVCLLGKKSNLFKSWIEVTPSMDVFQETILHRSALLCVHSSI